MLKKTPGTKIPGTGFPFRVQVTVGTGIPVAAHDNTILLFCITSWLLGATVILGGTKISILQLSNLSTLILNIKTNSYDQCLTECQSAK